MGLAPAQVRAAAAGSLQFHPRVQQQGLLAGAAAHERLLGSLPDLMPLRGEYADVLAIVDWDHRLPSRSLTLRLLLYASSKSAARGRAALGARARQIAAKDRFPEFDVPDLGGLPADEAYEAPIELASGALGALRLVSPWRRGVDAGDARTALAAVRAAEEFERTRSAAVPRPEGLGDLEVVGWCPPCETGHGRWTLDVWYLTSFDGRLVTGRSFLVDLETNGVVGAREFSARVTI